jgi:hypothetical protein
MIDRLPAPELQLTLHYVARSVDTFSPSFMLRATEALDRNLVVLFGDSLLILWQHQFRRAD